MKKNYTGFIKHCETKNLSSGFTLIELMIVMVIIGLLASISIVSLAPAREKARDIARKANIRNMRTALELYYDKYSHYPEYSVYIAGPTGCGGHGAGVGTDNWCDLEEELEEFISPLPRPPLYIGEDYGYFYSSNNVNNCSFYRSQGYGLATGLERCLNHGFSCDEISVNDRGFYDYLWEVGPDIVPCANKSESWW